MNLRAACDAASAWIEADPSTADVLRPLIANESPELIDMFAHRLAFGTAGLRGAMGPGPNRMNAIVVAQTTIGLMNWLAGRGETEPRIVIGFDGRHQSETFADQVAAVVARMGGHAERLPRPLPTPVLAHAVLMRQATAGIMITASHNPPADNGYKLYLADGIQLISPDDHEIAQEILAISDAPLPDLDPNHSAITILDESVVTAHLDAAVAALVTTQRDLRCVYSAMHGVGGDQMLAAFSAAGFDPPVVVPEQFAPDPDFPTVPFPNPEEAGAMDLAHALAVAVGADVALANDPDADRLAVSIPSREDPTEYVRLSGDQVGVLVADHLFRHLPPQGHGAKPDRIVANSMVSSQLLSAMADAAGIRSIVTLTGFKWVARPIVDFPDAEYILGYEEALGYCVGARVRDKDGISAALVVAEMVADARSKGETLWDRLDRLSLAHGVFVTGPVTIWVVGTDGLTRRSELLAELIANPPMSLGGATLVRVEDLSEGTQWPPTEGIMAFYDDDTRVIVRPSGTEPKLKAYIEVIEPVGESPKSADTDKQIAQARARAEARLARFQNELEQVLTPQR